MKHLESTEFRWAPRVGKEDIHKLYLSDAAGNLDETLLDEVGIGIYIRCETIKNVTERRCPTCSEQVRGANPSAEADREISCPVCRWTSTWQQYHRSYKQDRIHGGRAYPFFLAFLQEYPSCRTPREKLLAIDRLIHQLHEDIKGKYVTPAAMNLIHGKFKDIRDFIEQLAYGDNMPTQNKQLRSNLFSKMDKASEIMKQLDGE